MLLRNCLLDPILIRWQVVLSSQWPRRRMARLKPQSIAVYPNRLLEPRRLIRATCECVGPPSPIHNHCGKHINPILLQFQHPRTSNVRCATGQSLSNAASGVVGWTICLDSGNQEADENLPRATKTKTPQMFDLHPRPKQLYRRQNHKSHRVLRETRRRVVPPSKPINRSPNAAGSGGLDDLFGFGTKRDG